METTVKEVLSEKLKLSNEDVKAKLIDHMYNEEVARRTAACLKVITKIQESDKELAKLSRGDVETFNEAGEPNTPVYTKERVDALKKAKETNQKLLSALDSALNKNDFKKVLELGN